MAQATRICPEPVGKRFASLIRAPLWALWHLPLMGNEFPWPIVPPFLISVFGATFMLTWLFNGTNGSVLLPMVFHANVNTVGAGLIFPLFSGEAIVLLWWIYSLVWLATGLAALSFMPNKKAPVIAALEPPNYSNRIQARVRILLPSVRCFAAF